MPSSPDARSLGPVAAIPAHELVLAQLRRSIHLGHFGAGDKLPPERELAKLLGVSRSTLYGRLEAAGRGGAKLAPPDPGEGRG